MTDHLLIQRLKQRGKQPKTGPNAPIHRTIKAGSLLQIARTPLVRELLYEASTVIGHVSVEASQLAHLHIMRCAEENLSLPDMSSSNDFWYPVYKCIRDLRYFDLETCVDEDLFASAQKYAQDIQAPVLPTNPQGIKIPWTDGSQDWKMDVMKATAAHHAVNAGELWSSNVWSALGKLIGSLMLSADGIPDEITLSLKAAILSSVWKRTPLFEVSNRFKRLKNLERPFFSRIEQLIDAWDIRCLVPDADENLGALAKKLYVIRRRLIDLHPLGEAVQYQQEQPPLESTLPHTSVPSEKLVQWLRKAVEDGLTRKIYKRCISRVLDFLRIHKGGYFREPEDLSFPRQPGTKSKAYEIQRAMLNCIFGKPLELFSPAKPNPTRPSMEAAKPNRPPMEAEDREWIESTISQLQEGLIDPFNVDDASAHVLQCLIPLIEGKLLRSRWKRDLTKGKEGHQKRPQIPALSPMRRKRAPHIAITGESVKKLASVVSQHDKGIAKKLNVKLIELNNAAKARTVALNAAKKSSLDNFQVDEELERQYEKNKEEFLKKRPKKSRKQYPKTDDEKAYFKAKDKAAKSVDGVAGLENSKNVAEMEYQSLVWSTLFKIKHGKDGWSFDGRLTTDGVDTSLAYVRRKTPEENAAEGAAKESGKSKSELKKDAKAIKNAVAWARARQLAADPTAPPPRVFDPGMDGHTGCVIDEECFRRLNEVNNKHFQLIELHKTWMDRQSGAKKAASRINEWREQNEVVRHFEANAPSHKVATSEEFTSYCERTNERLGDVYRFYTQNCVRRLRFMRVCRQQAMLEEAVVKICGTSDREQQKKTVVVFGDASINSGKCGKAKVCHGELLEFLERRCCLVRIDEFRSSQRCCCCDAQLEEPMVCEGATSSKSWKKRVCVNGLCNRLFWQRDVNACINLARFFLWKLRGEEFPACFRRGNVVEEEEDLTGGETNI